MLKKKPVEKKAQNGPIWPILARNGPIWPETVRKKSDMIILDKLRRSVSENDLAGALFMPNEKEREVDS